MPDAVAANAEHLVIRVGEKPPETIGNFLDLCEHFTHDQTELVWNPSDVQLMWDAPNPRVRTRKDLWFYLVAHQACIKTLNINFCVLLDHPASIPREWRLAPDGSPAFIGLWGSLYRVPPSRYGPGDNIVFGIKWVPAWFPRKSYEGRWRRQFIRMASPIKASDAVAYLKP